jgi:hypothetical protein
MPLGKLAHHGYRYAINDLAQGLMNFGTPLALAFTRFSPRYYFDTFVAAAQG